jgi:glucokinase
MRPETQIGIDLGGTNIRGAVVHGNRISNLIGRRINAQSSQEEVLAEVYHLIDDLMQPSVTSIGMGVPGLVDEEKGLVYDVVYIPSWKELPLQARLQERYGVPVFLNNDANCFALGEFYFGKGVGHNSMIGLTIGTGLGGGLIVNKKLHAGRSGAAGEFGMMPYLDQCYEYYASGQFFMNVHRIDGETVFDRAKEGDEKAMALYSEMGHHLGNAIKAILYALDIDLIVLGGSVRQAYPWFEKSMWQQIYTTAFQRSAKSLRIEISELPNAGLLGAAALYYDAKGAGV